MIDEKIVELWVDAHKKETLQALGLYDFLPNDTHPKKYLDTVLFEGKEYILDENPEYRLDGDRYIYCAYAEPANFSQSNNIEYEYEHKYLIIWIVGYVGKPGRPDSIYNNPIEVCLWDKPDEVKDVTNIARVDDDPENYNYIDALYYSDYTEF